MMSAEAWIAVISVLALVVAVITSIFSGLAIAQRAHVSDAKKLADEMVQVRERLTVCETKLKIDCRKEHR